MEFNTVLKMFLVALAFTALSMPSVAQGPNPPFQWDGKKMTVLSESCTSSWNGCRGFCSGRGLTCYDDCEERKKYCLVTGIWPMRNGPWFTGLAKK